MSAGAQAASVARRSFFLHLCRRRSLAIRTRRSSIPPAGARMPARWHPVTSPAGWDRASVRWPSYRGDEPRRIATGAASGLNRAPSRIESVEMRRECDARQASPVGDRLGSSCAAGALDRANERGSIGRSPVERSGDRGALRDLLACLSPRLVRWARGRLPRWARRGCDTEDLVQCAVAGALAREETLSSVGARGVLGYLRASIRNRVVDEIRGAALRARADPALEARACPPNTPLAEVLDLEARAAFLEARCRLPERAQLLVVGRLDLGLSYEVLARSLGYPSSDSARMAAKRAVLEIGKMIGESARTPEQSRTTGGSPTVTGASPSRPGLA